jgi:hypothetical protein
MYWSRFIRPRKLKNPRTYLTSTSAYRSHVKDCSSYCNRLTVSELTNYRYWHFSDGSPRADDVGSLRKADLSGRAGGRSEKTRS